MTSTILYKQDNPNNIPLFGIFIYKSPIYFYNRLLDCS